MEYIDDRPVVEHQVRFRNRVPVTETDAPLVRDGNTVVWLLRARSSPPLYTSPSPGSEERVRVNVQIVEDAVPLAGSAGESATAYLDWRLDGDTPEGASLFDPAHFGPGVHGDLYRLRRLLEDRGHLRDDEDPVDTVARLLSAAVPANEHPQPIAGSPVTAPPEPDGVEVVGTIHRGATTQRYLDEAFGTP